MKLMTERAKHHKIKESDSIKGGDKKKRFNLSIPKLSEEEEKSIGEVVASYFSQRKLRIFLCHSTTDKPIVRNLYQRLCAEGVEPWLDEESLLPGQDWDQEIAKAVRQSDVVLVCLSHSSVNKAGYVQKEIKYALDVADEQPEGTIFLIPVKLEECEIPGRLRRWHWVNLFEDIGYERLMRALRARERTLRLIRK
jgi:hypothetical protein